MSTVISSRRFLFNFVFRNLARGECRGQRGPERRKKSRCAIGAMHQTERRVTGMRRRFFRECGGDRVAVKAKVG